MNGFGSAVLVVALAALTHVAAQSIPYGVIEKEKLDLRLRDAKASLASQPNDLTSLKVAGIASHQLASVKVEGASAEAVAYLKRASELEPENAELLAYLGSAYAMAGRDSSFVVNKVLNVNKGLAFLDKAVSKSPKDLDIRFIRASVSYELPAMFARKATAESDYLVFVNQVQSGEAQVDSKRLAEAYFKLGQLAREGKQPSKAAEFYAQAQRVHPQSEWAQRAAKAQR